MRCCAVQFLFVRVFEVESVRKQTPKDIAIEERDD